MPIQLDLSSVIPALLGVLRPDYAAFATPHLQSLIEAAFFASMQREEGRPLRFAVALVTPAMMESNAHDGPTWHPDWFVASLPFDAIRLTKLAPAIDPAQTLLAIAPHESGLGIVGVIRTTRMHNRFAAGELSSGILFENEPVILRVFDVGSMHIDIGTGRLGTLSKGSFQPSGITVFVGGSVWLQLYRFAQGSGHNPSDYLQLVQAIVARIAERGHGGTVIITSKPTTHLDIRYGFRAPSSAISEAFRVAAGAGISGRPEVFVGELSEEDIRREADRRRTVERVRFWDDIADFGADLANVDGALVFQADLRIIGFGAHITYGEPVDTPTQLELGHDHGSTTAPSPLPALGTRHNSAARFCYNEPGALAFVVSQDGDVSCMLRPSDEVALSIWRPVALQWHLSLDALSPPA